MPLNPAIRRYVYQSLELLDLPEGEFVPHLPQLEASIERSKSELTEEDKSKLELLAWHFLTSIGIPYEMRWISEKPPAPIPPDQQAREEQLRQASEMAERFPNRPRSMAEAQLRAEIRQYSDEPDRGLATAYKHYDRFVTRVAS